ncbi:hypothetical protein UPYG_G00120350 [Umbra pygmaea]|uniref:Coiled-coil alpha-helical rod protein 1 n=1 Tax=Umbra pygmaea TaxID=75934 RepID=A0ABD0XM61_UMBPY
MERRNEDDQLNVPSDFLTSFVAKESEKTLIPPSHFTASSQLAPVKVAECRGQASDTGLVNPWLTMAQTKQDIVELHSENQRILTVHGDSSRGRKATEDFDKSRTRWEARCSLSTEHHRAESERLRGQVEALKEAEERHRGDLRNKDSILNRQSRELEVMREELFKTKIEVSQISVELVQKKQENDNLDAQLEKLKVESVKEVERLRSQLEEARQEAQRLSREAEAAKLQAGEEARQEAQRLSKEAEAAKLQAGEEARQEAQRLKMELEECHSRHETKLQQLKSSHDTELSTVRETSFELQERFSHMTQELTHLKGTLLDVSAERDGLKEQLRKMSDAFEIQSATLQSLRSYVGDMSPRRVLEDKLTETVQKLNQEKEALQVTTELLTVRLNSVNDILALQEEEILEKTLSEPLLKAGSKGTRVLRRWREKVFMLLVQLHTKDIELRGEKDKLHSIILSLEHEVKKERCQCTVLQHSLQDRTAELDLERVSKEAMKQDLARTRRENTELKNWSQESGAVLRTMAVAVQGFSQAFEVKMSEMEIVQTRLNSFGHRLTFAKRRVDTIQGLMMRKEALWKVQQTTKATNPVSESISVRELQAELALACEERDKLTQELKRTPVLIETALVDVREQFNSEVTLLRQAAEQSRVETQEAQTAREEAQHRLHQAHTELEESRLSLEHLHAQLTSQQESSVRALKEALCQTEDRYNQQLRMMESQLNTARREHTKAVVALRQIQRQAEREREQEREAQRLQSEHTQRELQDLHKLLQEKDRDRNLLLATVREKGLVTEYKAARTNTLLSSVALKEQQKSSGKSRSLRAKPQTRDSLLSVLEDLQTLRAEVVHSSEDDSEEENQGEAAVDS